MDKSYLNYGRQSIDDADIEAVVEILRGDLITSGPAVERFEKALAKQVGARHAIAVSSGTAGLHISCLAAGVGAGDVGVVPTLTFAATANALLYCGANVVLTDVDADSLNLSPATLAAAVGTKPIKAVLPVHFAGLPVNLTEIRNAVGTEVTIIEDACHALGATDEGGRPVGSCSVSDMTVFSFHPVKPITTGEGGAITTNDDELAHRLRMLRSHGMERDFERLQDPAAACEKDGAHRPWYYEQQVLGFNYRMTDIQAALGLSQLGKLDGFIARRREISAYYDQRFANLDHVSLPQSKPSQRAVSGQHLYLLDIDFEALGTHRTRLKQNLHEIGVGSQVHYIPVHRQPYHRERGNFAIEDFPNVERYHSRALSIPLYPHMTDEQVEYVADRIIGQFR